MESKAEGKWMAEAFDFLRLFRRVGRNGFGLLILEIGWALLVLLLGQLPHPDGPPAVELPLTLQDQTLQLGHFRLLKLPEMIW